jgi:hypothetical protein
MKPIWRLGSPTIQPPLIPSSASAVPGVLRFATRPGTRSCILHGLLSGFDNWPCCIFPTVSNLRNAVLPGTAPAKGADVFVPLAKIIAR